MFDPRIMYDPMAIGLVLLIEGCPEHRLGRDIAQCYSRTAGNPSGLERCFLQEIKPYWVDEKYTPLTSDGKPIPIAQMYKLVDTVREAIVGYVADGKLRDYTDQLLTESGDVERAFAHPGDATHPFVDGAEVGSFVDYARKATKALRSLSPVVNAVNPMWGASLDTALNAVDQMMTSSDPLSAMLPLQEAVLAAAPLVESGDYSAYYSEPELNGAVDKLVNFYSRRIGRNAPVIPVLKSLKTK